MSVIEAGESKDVVCPGCNRQFKRIGSHWSQASCQRPQFTSRQLELLKGLNLGDGSIKESSGGKCWFVVKSVRPAFLNWLGTKFGALSAGVRLVASAETQKNHAQTRGGEWADYDYQDLYLLRLRGHPMFDLLREKWYPGGGDIRFPPDLELSPETLRMWFVSDGGLDWSGNGTCYPAISCHNETDRADFIQRKFADIGFDVGYSSGRVRIKAADTERFLDYIGAPVPGFAYKWARDDRETYDSLKP